MFRTGDPGDALYIVARGTVEVLNDDGQRTLAELGDGQAFGEMALLSGGTRTATVRAKTDSQPAGDRQGRLRQAAGRGSVPQRAGAQAQPRARDLEPAQRPRSIPALWAQTGAREPRASQPQRRAQAAERGQGGQGRGPGHRVRQHPRHHPGLPGDRRQVRGLREPVDDPDPRHVPGRHSRGGGERHHAAPRRLLQPPIFLLWSTVLAAGIVAAVAGKVFISDCGSTAAVLAQAVAGGAILALVTHAMIPEALHKGGSGIVLPAVGGFLFALYLALLEPGLAASIRRRRPIAENSSRRQRRSAAVAPPRGPAARNVRAGAT